MGRHRMKITKTQLKKIIKEEKRKLGEGEQGDDDYEVRRARRAAEDDLETALGRLLDMHIDQSYDATTAAYVDRTLISNGIREVKRFVNMWAKQQKETEGLPREDWE